MAYLNALPRDLRDILCHRAADLYHLLQGDHFPLQAKQFHLHLGREDPAQEMRAQEMPAQEIFVPPDLAGRIDQMASVQAQVHMQCGVLQRDLVDPHGDQVVLRGRVPKARQDQLGHRCVLDPLLVPEGCLRLPQEVLAHHHAGDPVSSVQSQNVGGGILKSWNQLRYPVLMFHLLHQFPRVKLSLSEVLQPRY